MADHHHNHHHQQHRPNRLSVPLRTTTTVGRAYPSFPYTPTPTPSKTRTRSIHGTTKSSISFLFLILFSLRSLYSLLPFLRSSPSFSLFPFSFLVSLLSFVFSLAFSLFSAFSPSKKDSFLRQNRSVFSIASLSASQIKLILAKSVFLAVVFLLRFQALRYCGAAAMILAELSGTVSARVLSESRNRLAGDHGGLGSSKVRGFCLLFAGLLLLSISWDRVDCFPFSSSSVENWGFWIYPKENCLRIWPMLLPFLSGFLGCYEKVSMNWVEIKHLDQKRVRLISLFITTVFLFPLAIWSFVFSATDEVGVSIGNLGWPLANTVVFGVLLSENYNDDKFSSSKNDSEREFLVTFLCTIVLELFYFPELSLWGLLLCGLLLYVAVRELDSVYTDYQEIGMESPESFSTMFMKPIRHILSEKKSRKIALFLLINTGYMVVEFVAGFMSNSLGLISDACHMLFDCAALAIGLYASYISRLPANHQFNYGRGRFEVLSGYVNAVFLVLVGALIVLESIERILDPQEISTNSLLVVSVGGLLVNVVGLIFFHEEHHHAHGGSGCTHSHSHESHSHKHEEHHGNDHHHHSPKHEEHHECNHNHDHHHHSLGHKHEEHHGHDHHHHSDHKTAKGENKEHRHIDHNMEGIFLHVLADTMGSVGVVISTLFDEDIKSLPTKEQGEDINQQTKTIGEKQLECTRDICACLGVYIPNQEDLSNKLTCSRNLTHQGVITNWKCFKSVPDEEDIQVTNQHISKELAGDQLPLIGELRSNQDESSCETIYSGEPTHHRHTSNWNWYKRSYGLKVIQLLNQEMPHLPYLDAFIQKGSNQHKFVTYQSYCVLSSPFEEYTALRCTKPHKNLQHFNKSHLPNLEPKEINHQQLFSGQLAYLLKTYPTNLGIPKQHLYMPKLSRLKKISKSPPYSAFPQQLVFE